MSDIDLVKIGFISKTHGYDGVMKLSVEEEFQGAIQQSQFLFIDIESMRIPFLIQKLHAGATFLCKLEDIDAKEIAVKYNSLSIYIERKYIKDTQAEESFKSLLGYLVHNQDQQIGILKDIQEFPQQLMGVILHKDQEILIPLHDDLIIEIEHEHKTIRLELPEGLLELN